MKIVYSDPKTGRSAQQDLTVESAAMFLNRKIGETIDGGAIGLAGYKLKITGGSDSSGFPLQKSIEGPRKTTMFSTVSTVGSSRGMQRRKTVRGNTISNDTMQLNLVIVEYGEKPVDEIFPKKDGAAAEKKE